MAQEKSNELYALVDMGSNGIRFSISNLSPPTARLLPTVYQDRASISLYDAQFRPGSDSRHPIPDDVQKQVVAHLTRFKQTCLDFDVPESSVAVLATEATRLAPNSAEFRTRIKSATGWDVQMLSKEDEGRIGAFGVASSLADVEGLVMDLGGGSAQITWMVSADGEVQTSPRGALSFPYGAAALTRRLEEARKMGKKAVRALEREMLENLQRAYRELEIPDAVLSRAKNKGGLDLYLSGGGFRGWGYLLMSQSRVNPYPIPIINGFCADKADFQDTTSIANIVATTDSKEIFRISERRASQVPAVAFLINVLTQAIPCINTIHFCQGGVREGYLFQSLPRPIRSQHPLIVATSPHRTPSSMQLASLLASSLPLSSETPPSEPHRPTIPTPFANSFFIALSNMLYAHAPCPKDIRPAAALHSTTTGALASTHGLSHHHRALLALTLYARWSGDLAPPDAAHLMRMQQLVSMEEAWWCRYLGRVASLVGDVYPAGVVREGEERIEFEASWVQTLGKKGKKKKWVLALTIRVARGGIQGGDGEIGAMGWFDAIQEPGKRIEKVGKKKNWIKAAERADGCANEDWGVKVSVTFTTMGGQMKGSSLAV
ncbi:hypothetical protein VTO42DRAFT_1508 [Malbranchea cinnamomea]